MYHISSWLLFGVLFPLQKFRMYPSAFKQQHVLEIGSRELAIKELTLDSSVMSYNTPNSPTKPEVSLRFLHPPSVSLFEVLMAQPFFFPCSCHNSSTTGSIRCGPMAACGSDRTHMELSNPDPGRSLRATNLLWALPLDTMAKGNIWTITKIYCS